MTHVNKNLLSLMDGLFGAAKSGGIVQQLLIEVPQIRDMLFEFRQNAQPAAQFGESRPGLAPSGGRGETGGQNARRPATPASNVGLLSPRQCEILKLIARGGSNKQIARIVGVGPETVKTHVSNIFVKLSVKNRAQAVSRAQNLGLVVIDDAMFLH
jgi:LuxR family maltose regulon positive regulatory protein